MPKKQTCHCVLTMMTRKLPLILVLMAMIVSTVSFLPVQEARASLELAYDDGDKEARTSAPQGGYFAVKFSLPSGCSMANLLSARFYKVASQGGGTNVVFHILGSNGVTELTTPVTYDIAVDNSWNELGLSSKNIVVTGDFWVAVEYLTADDPYLGLDTSSVAGRSYSGTPGFWNPGIQANLMIRAVIECIGAPVGGVVLPTNALAILAPFAALAGLIVAVSAVIAVKRRRD